MAVPNFSFETPSQSGGYSYGSNVSGGSWTFNGSSGSGSGIEANGSGFGAPTAPNGTQAGFIQNTGAIQQSIALTASNAYKLTLRAAQRNFGAKAQAVQATVTFGSTTLTLTFTSSDGGALSSGNIAPSAITQVFYTYTATFSLPGVLNAFVAQSQAPVTLTTNVSAQTGVDFGYNFDTVVNSNDAGQGSLRQFITNANTLTNANLAQVGQLAGREVSIFMVPDGNAHNGQRSGLNSGLTGVAGAARAIISITSAVLPAVTDARTFINGITQTTNIGDTNNGQMGTGGTVGVNALAFSKVNRPEIEVSVANSLATGLDLNADSLGVIGIALHGSQLRVGNATAVRNLQILSNLIGITATTVGDPGGTAYNPDFGILIRGTSYGLVRGNLIGYAGNSGLSYSGGANTAGLKVVRNEFVQNGYRVTGGDAITLGDQVMTGPVVVAYNLITTSNSDGLQFEIGQVGSGGINSIRNNTFFDNGNGSSSLNRNQLEGAAILYLQRNGSRTGTNADSIYYNIINQSQASGIVVGYGQRNIIITRNSTYGNGTSRNSSTGGNLSIDIVTRPNYYVGAPSTSGNGNGATDYGNGDGVTPNTGALNTAYANAGMNYPVFTLTRYNSSTSITVQGYVGGAAGQTAFANATIDLYFSNNLDGNNNGAVVAGDGQNVPHGEGQTYLTTIMADANGNFNNTIAAPAGVTFSTTGQSLTATAYLSTAGTSEFGPNSVLAAVVVSGYVFEDVNYGGGAGRSRATLASGAVGRPGATVEIYNSSNAIVSSTTTDANGQYSFNVPSGNYTVRTVVSTVTSSRGTNYSTSLPVPVQTYVRGNVNRVGGEDPTITADAVAAATIGATLTFVGSNPSGLDNTGFVDNVLVLDANGNALATNPIVNQSFENPNIGPNGTTSPTNVPGCRLNAFG